MFFDKKESLHNEEFQLWKDSFEKYGRSILAAKDDIICLFNLWERLAKARSLSKRESTLILVLLYLLAVEGHACNRINFVSFLLVGTGHDLYSSTKRKYVKENMEEIQKVEMSRKIAFLNHHGFKPITKEYDSTFRNDIAHHNYSIDKKGTLYIRGKSVDLTSKARQLTKFINLTEEAIEQILQEF